MSYNLKEDILRAAEEARKIKEIKEREEMDLFKKIANDRVKYGYDSICLRVQAMADELALYRSQDESSPYYKNYKHWKNFYGDKALKIFNILDDLLDGHGHSCD